MSENEETGKTNQVQLVGTEEIELPTLDLKPYVGRKVKIEEVTEHKGEFGYYIIVHTEAVDTIENASGEKIQIKASQLFGLKENAEGKIGWTPQMKLGKHLKKMKAKHYKDLVGKEVQIVTLYNSNKEQDYLSYN